jgi:hypothetical protein
VRHCTRRSCRRDGTADLIEAKDQFRSLGCFGEVIYASANARHVDVRVERQQRDGIFDVDWAGGDRLEDQQVFDARHRDGDLAKARRGACRERFVLEGCPAEGEIEIDFRGLVPVNRTRFAAANASAASMRGMILYLRSASMRTRIDTVSPWMTASISLVMRCTPWAMTAIPPITIHGGPASESARFSAASASSIRDRSRSRGAGMSLDASPAVPHLLDGMLADRIARAGPVTHRLERGQCGQCVGYRARRPRSFSGSQRVLELSCCPLAG